MAGFSRSQKKATLFRAYLLSDVVLIALVLLALTPFIQRTLRAVNERSVETLSSVVAQNTDNLDRLFTNLESMLLSTHNESFAMLSTVIGKANGSDYYKMHLASQHLRSLVQANPALHDILISYSGNNVVITSTGGFDSTKVFASYYASETLYSDLFGHNASAYFIKDRLLQYGSPQRYERVLGYCFSLSQFSRGRACVLLKTGEFLNESVLQAIGDQGFLRLTDYAGNVLLSLGTPAPDDGSLDSRYVTVQYKSLNGKLMAQAGTPRLLPSSALYGVLVLLALCLLVALVVGVALSSFNAYRHVKPVKQLMDELNHHSTKITGSQSEIDTLRTRMNKLSIENEGFQAQLANYRATQYESVITRLFTASHFSPRELAHMLSVVGEVPTRYVVAYGTLENLPLADTHQDEMSLLALDYVKQNLSQACLCYAVPPLALAVLISDEVDIERLKMAGGVSINWTFSQVSEGIENISRALEEARLVREWGGIVRPSVALSDFQHLYQHLIAGNSAKAIEQVCAVFEKANVDSIRYYHDCIRFVVFLAAQASELPIVAPLYDATQGLEILREELCETIHDFCEAINREKRSHNETLRENILQYIQQNFQDSGLYAGLIADRAGISEKYLYNFVKEQTGYSVGDYLQQLRMNRAAEILCEQGVPVKEVHALVGFNSENTFYKAFKRSFGVSPSQYRQTNAK